MSKYSEMSVEELQVGIKAGRQRRMIVGGIFGLIILAWLVLGYWQTNLPVFATTVVMAGVLLMVTNRAPQEMAAELEKRSQGS